MLNRERTTRRKVCFEVDDFEKKSLSDPELITKLETSFPPMGATTMHINVAQNLYCVVIEAPDLQVRDLLNVFSQLGLEARPKGDASE